MPENINFCTYCGGELKKARRRESSLIGFSPKINDPAFARYIKHSNTWSLLFACILAAAAIIGFYIYGETSAEMDNQEALFIGLGIGGMFVAIALYQVWGRKTSKTWDGTVTDKKINQKRRKKRSGEDYYWEDYTEYVVVLRDDRGKDREITAEDDDTCYNYYQTGDRVRRHGGLNTYEKYDKSGDSIIFCSACAYLCDIDDDCCPKCKCPLLK
jgi:hypothetical protein